ncbi:MAG: GNAT family N-acetyltransferase [Bacteroidales bacterium]|nr:GNAT family N-acetyltransferase [Bacteroidales bacterium]
MKSLIEIQDIDKSQWDALIQSSPVATWFQTQEAFGFFDSLSFMEAFAVAVESEGKLKGLAVGYVQKDGGRLKQFLSRRAVILGGPLLADDISDEELATLLNALKDRLKRKVIFIETRNFNDYSRWRTVFEQCGFGYEPHLNFHVNTETKEIAQANIGKHRWRYIRISMRDGAKLVEIPTWEQVEKFYGILTDLFETKVKTPLFPIAFFKELFKLQSAKFFLVEYEGEIIGGSICVCLEGRTVYEWVKCGNEHFHKNIRPSSLVTWLGIEYAAENGYPRYDFMGAGKPNEAYGVRDFKAEFGGELVEHGRFIHVCNPVLFSLGKLGVKIMKKL